MNRSSFTLKALTAALILASTTGVVFAKGYKGDFKGEACPPPQMLKTGWYLGLQGGYESYRIRTELESATIDGIGFAANPVFAANGWVGGLFLGYGQMFNDWFYLGGEVFGNISGAEQTQTFVVDTADGDNISNTFDIDGSWGVGLLPGVKMTDSTLTYIRLGWNWASIKASATVADTDGTTVTGSTTNTSNGFVFGFGMETLVMDNWSLRGEFDHTWYSNFNALSASSGVGTIEIKPSDNQFMAAVIYHFG